MNYGRYKIVKELGKGAMGVVFQAHDPQIDRMVALKVLREEKLSSDYFVERFFKEAKAIGRLSHPNIVTVYDVGQDHDTIYIAMEYLEGKPLDEAVKGKKLSSQEIVDIGSQLSKALKYAHSKGIIHRDIKPTNIIITSDGQTKITDFGIARIDDPNATKQTLAGEILGTPVYMSPEQIMGKTIDGRSDLYSLGVFLYLLATRKRPFSGDNLAVVFKAITQDIPTPPASLDVSVSTGLSDLIMKSLNKNPDERFQTGNEMAEALKGCLLDRPDNKQNPEVSSFPFDQEKKDSNEPQEIADEPKKQSGNNLVLIAITVVILLCAASGIYLWKTSDSGETKVSGGERNIEKSEFGILNIESIPTDSSIYVNGSIKGKTPLKIKLLPDTYEIKLGLQGYYDWEAQVKVNRDSETPVFGRLFPIEEK